MKINIEQLAAEFTRLKTGQKNGSIRYPSNIKKTAVRLYAEHPDKSSKEFSQLIGVSESAFVRWITDDNAANTVTQDSFVPVTTVGDDHVASKPRAQEIVSRHGLAIIYVPGDQVDLVVALVNKLMGALSC